MLTIFFNSKEEEYDMARSHQTWSKREREKTRQKTQQEKLERRMERKQSPSASKSLTEMMAYVDENGNLTSVPQPLQRNETTDKN